MLKEDKLFALLGKTQVEGVFPSSAICRTCGGAKLTKDDFEFIQLHLVNNKTIPPMELCGCRKVIRKSYKVRLGIIRKTTTIEHQDIDVLVEGASSYKHAEEKARMKLQANLHNGRENPAKHPNVAIQEQPGRWKVSKFEHDTVALKDNEECEETNATSVDVDLMIRVGKGQWKVPEPEPESV